MKPTTTQHLQNQPVRVNSVISTKPRPPRTARRSVCSAFQKPWESHDITEYLATVQSHRDCPDQVVTALYSELRRIAAITFRWERGNQTLQPTALANEAFLRLFPRPTPWKNRREFFGASVRSMRRILIERARARNAQKRGGRATQTVLEETMRCVTPKPDALLDIDTGICELARVHPRQARIVEMRFFGGLSVEEVAHVLSLSRATVGKEWQRARDWLRRRLER
jgi:RNA polymerase sigma-70 factor (ECF subfamily)